MWLRNLSHAWDILKDLDNYISDSEKIQEVVIVHEGDEMKFKRDEEGEWELLV